MDELAIRFNEDVTKYTQRSFINQLRQLKDGQEFKNWKEFMSYMGEPYKNNRQLKEFQNKTSYYAAVVNPEGHKMKIFPIRNDEFNIPLPLESKELSLLIQAVLISVIRHNIQLKNRNIQCSKKALALACGMVGSQFYMYANQQGRLKHESYETLYLEDHPEDKDQNTGKKKKGVDINISEEESYEISTLVAEYYESMLGKVKYHVESAIKSLAHSDLLMYEEVYYIIEREEEFIQPKHNKFGDEEYVKEIKYKPGRIRRATDEEMQTRLDIYASVLKEMGYKTVDSLPSSLRQKYHETKTKRANQEMKIWGFFKGYNMNTTADIEYCYQTIMQKVEVISNRYLAKGQDSLETAKRQAIRKYHNGFANNSASDFMERICKQILDKTFFIEGKFNARSAEQKYYELGGGFEDDDDLDNKLK